jgi:hypothetical protein
VHWYCNPRDGKFIETPCATCKKFYCWDGKIFSEEKGYTPPPAYVLSYWDEVHRRSQQIRSDIEQTKKELAEQVQKGAQDSKRMNEERLQAHQAFMEDLDRRAVQSRSSQSPLRSGEAAVSRRANPQMLVLAPPRPTEPAPVIPPSSRAKVSEIQPGMDRAEVERILGKPHSAMAVTGVDGMVETLSYRLEDHGTARVRIEKGKVVSVKIPE